MTKRRAALYIVLCLLFVLSLFSFPRYLLMMVPVFLVGEPTQEVMREQILENDASSTFATSTLFVLGDVMLARHVEAHMLRDGASYPYLGVPFLSEERAYVLANFEAAIPVKHDKTPNFAMRFSVSAEFLPALREAGVTHLGLANNHALDYGVEGFINLKNRLAEADLQSFGQPGTVGSTSVSYIDLRGKKIAVVALENVTSQIDAKMLASLLEVAERESDLQIAYVHWGEEYLRSPQVTQQAVARELVLLGIDLIIGHHPHVVQGMARVEGVPVFYSLGNFIFDQYFSREVQEGLILKLGAAETGIVISGIPVTSLSTQAQPRQMTENESLTFYEKLAEVSDQELLAELQQGELTVSWSLATSEETVMMSQ